MFETARAIGLECSEEFSKPGPTLGTAVAIVASVLFLPHPVEDLPIGTAYAVRTGIGAVVTASLGVVFLDGPTSFARVGFVSVIVVGIAGLHAAGGRRLAVSSPGRPTHFAFSPTPRRRCSLGRFIPRRRSPFDDAGHPAGHRRHHRHAHRRLRL